MQRRWYLVLIDLTLSNGFIKMHILACAFYKLKKNRFHNTHACVTTQVFAETGHNLLVRDGS